MVQCQSILSHARTESLAKKIDLLKNNGLQITTYAELERRVERFRSGESLEVGFGTLGSPVVKEIIEANPLGISGAKVVLLPYIKDILEATVKAYEGEQKTLAQTLLNHYKEGGIVVINGIPFSKAETERYSQDDVLITH